LKTRKNEKYIFPFSVMVIR